LIISFPPTTFVPDEMYESVASSFTNSPRGCAANLSYRVRRDICEDGSADKRSEVERKKVVSGWRSVIHGLVRVCVDFVSL